MNDAPAGHQQHGHHAGGHGLHVHRGRLRLQRSERQPGQQRSLAVKITTLPGAGTLTNNGVAVTAGQFVSVADISGRPAGVHAGGQRQRHRLRQLHVPGAGRRRHGQWRGGPRSVAQHDDHQRHRVNDAPAGTDKTVTTLEDTAYTFTAADFGFSDPNDSPANSLPAVKITTLPARRHADQQRRRRDGRAVRQRRRHHCRPAGVHAGGQRQRHRLRQLHLPGAGRRRHRQWRGGPRSVAQHDHHQRHRGERRPGGHRQDGHHAGGHGLRPSPRPTLASAIRTTARPMRCRRSRSPRCRAPAR